MTPVELTVVAPTYNERDNLEPLVSALTVHLDGIAWEVIFVDDDSPDGTAARVRQLAQRLPRVRCLHRVGRRGLSSAAIEGVLASAAPYVAVIDADLQHDSSLLPRMLAELRRGEVDIVVGSRYADDGGVGEWNTTRARMSTAATRMARLVVTAELADPMSGYFMITRAAFDLAVHRLSGQGFKILLDLFASSPVPLRFKEIGFTFRPRASGESKLDSLVIWEYVLLLINKATGRQIPPRFLLFCLVGAVGVLVHMVALRLALEFWSFSPAQTVATGIAMTSNFFLNNVFTYRDRRLRGWRLLTGLLSFYLVCSLGAVANVGVAAAIFERDYDWWLAGLAGAALGAVWNYGASSVLTWSRRQGRAGSKSA
jgi:dolichol-phosphate mannosyltransferase